MPSVPLISARPSLAASSTGARPAAASASAAGISVAVGVAHLALAHQRQRAVRERREVAGAAERAVLVHHRRDPVAAAAPAISSRGLAADAGVPGRQRREPQQHQRAHHLALDLRAGAGGVRADQRALQLGAHLGRDVPGGQRAEPGRDAVRRRRAPRPAPRRLAGLLDRRRPRPARSSTGGPVAGDRDHVVEGERTDARRCTGLSWPHCTTPARGPDVAPARAGAPSCLGSEIARDDRRRWDRCRPRPGRCGCCASWPRQPDPVRSTGSRRACGLPRSHGLPPAHAR